MQHDNRHDKRHKKRAWIIRCPKCMKLGTERAASQRRFWRAKLAAGSTPL